MLKHLYKLFTAKCDTIPETDQRGKTDGEFPDEDEGGYFAYDMYPERRGETYRPSLMRRLLVGARREITLKDSCQSYVYAATINNPLVKLLLHALESSGCPVDIPRMFQCEICDPSVCGGYDAEYNQIVLCYNTIRFKTAIEGTMIHELIHVFDHCRNKLNFRNHEHVACTEIRAANFLHGGYMSCMMDGWVFLLDFKARHRDCVRARAIKTMVTSRGLPTAEATRIVDKVFDRCYADLEPFGRRVTSVYDMPMIEREGKYYGY